MMEGSEEGETSSDAEDELYEEEDDLLVVMEKGHGEIEKTAKEGDDFADDHRQSAFPLFRVFFSPNTTHLVTPPTDERSGDGVADIRGRDGIPEKGLRRALVDLQHLLLQQQKPPP